MELFGKTENHLYLAQLKHSFENNYYYASFSCVRRSQFFKIKIKIYLRLRKSQHLAIMLIEREISKKLDFSKIIDQFFVCKARRQHAIA